MTTHLTLPAPLRAYLERVEQGLTGLPAATRGDVLRELSSHLEDGLAQGLAPQAAIVFLSPSAEVQAKESAIPALHYKQLKDYVRKLPKDPAVNASALSKLDAAQAA